MSLEEVKTMLKDRNLLIAISSIRDDDDVGQPPRNATEEEGTNYLKKFLAVAGAEGHQRIVDAINKASQVSLDDALGVCRKRVPKSKWNGKNTWDEDKGVYLDAPGDDWIPSWYRRNGFIPVQKYLIDYYAKYTTAETLRKALWFASEQDIIDVHREANRWCSKHGFKRIQKRKERKARLSDSATALLIDSGILKRK